jgi:phosphohistidine phosphatase
LTLTLILTRHAKSDWDDPILDDHDRTLNERGRRSADAMGLWLAGQGLVPDTILCSSATRTRETCARISAALHPAPRAIFLQGLYLSGAQTMLNLLNKEAAGKTVMMIAHNPGTAIMAGMLADGPVAHRDFARYPTCFTSVFQFQTDTWREIDWGQGHVTQAIGPRELI